MSPSASAATLAAILVSGAFAAAGCTTQAQREAAQAERASQETAQEINRICALPPAEREVALEKLKAESGMVLYCGRR